MKNVYEGAAYQRGSGIIPHIVRRPFALVSTFETTNVDGVFGDSFATNW